MVTAGLGVAGVAGVPVAAAALTGVPLTGVARTAASSLELAGGSGPPAGAVPESTGIYRNNGGQGVGSEVRC